LAERKNDLKLEGLTREEYDRKMTEIFEGKGEAFGTTNLRELAREKLMTETSNRMLIRRILRGTYQGD